MFGRPSIFRGKDRSEVRPMTPKGRQLFEEARASCQRLARKLGMQGKAIEKVSDGDTIEYIVRGPKEAKEDLKAQVRAESQERL